MPTAQVSINADQRTKLHARNAHRLSHERKTKEACRRACRHACSLCSRALYVVRKPEYQKVTDHLALRRKEMAESTVQSVEEILWKGVRGVGQDAEEVDRTDAHHL